MPDYNHGHVSVQVLVSQMLASLKASSLVAVDTLPSRVEGRVAISQTLSSIKAVLEANGATGLSWHGVGPIALAKSALAYKVALDELLSGPTTPVNVVTYNGVSVTHNGELVTYTP